jgi:hypothetical protein
VAELEKAVRVLGGRGDLHRRVAGLAAEAAGLKVAEQRLQSDLRFCREKAARAEECARAAEERLESAAGTGKGQQGQGRAGPAAGPRGKGKSELVMATMSEQVRKYTPLRDDWESKLSRARWQW